MEKMKKYKKILLCALAALFATLLCIYLCIVLLLPAFLNSKTFIKKTQELVSKNTNCVVIADNVKMKITPFLSLYIKADKISATKNGTNILDIEGISGKAKLNKIKTLKAKKLFLNLDKIKTGKKTDKFRISSIPDIYLENAEIIFDETKEFKGNFSNLSIKEINRKKYIKFYGKFSSIFLKENVVLGEEGYLYTNKNAVFAKNFKVLSSNSSLLANGKIFDEKGLYDFYLKGENVNISDLMASILYFQKSKDASKKFIENFYNYSGTVDINLNFKNDGISGKCNAKNLAAVTVLFNAPVFFETANFYFGKTTLKSRAEGTIAGEKITHSLYVANLLSPERFIKGRIESELQGKISKYIPNLKTTGKQNISIEYYTKNKKSGVDYVLNLKPKADIFYKNANLGLTHKERRLFVHTLSYDNILYIKNYDYSILKDGGTLNIVTGRGLFTKIKDRMQPKSLTVKTNGFAPVSVIGSFDRFISGGEFSGNLKYDFHKNKILGSLIIKNAHHKDFFIKKAELDADKNCINILAEGNYRGEKFTTKMIARNKITNKIAVYNADLFLDKYTVRTKSAALGLRPYKNLKNSKVKNIDITIDNWKIRINKVTKDRIVLNNINLTGNLKNNIFRFSTSGVRFAKGTLSAKGLYDFNKNSSLMCLKIKNVSSETAADLIFNLKGQVKGIANAVLYTKTYNKFDDIKAKLVFKIDNGYLPKLGDLEIKNKFTRRSTKLSKIINIKDAENNPINPSESVSDIKGSFYMDNHILKDIAITSRQKNLSLLFEGEYDIESENTDLMIFGKYNSDAQKRAKVLFMPLSFVVKLIFRPENSYENYKAKFEKVPDINAAPDNVSLFRVKLNGSPKEDTMDVELKRIY